MQAMSVFEHDVQQRVAGLVPGGVLLSSSVIARLAASRPADFVGGLFQLFMPIGLFVSCSGQQSGFVHRLASSAPE